MGFLGLVMAYSMRLSLSVAITQMVPPLVLTTTNLTTEKICPFTDENYIYENLDLKTMEKQIYSVFSIFLLKLIDIKRKTEIIQ